MFALMIENPHTVFHMLLYRNGIVKREAQRNILTPSYRDTRIQSGD